jgi:hypothetical protein
LQSQQQVKSLAVQNPGLVPSLLHFGRAGSLQSELILQVVEQVQ